MLFANQKTVINDDYFKIINIVYPKIRHNIDKIIQSFEESKDASKYFVAYFSEGHSEIHSILGDRISCNDINQLLADLFLSTIKFDSNASNYEIPDLFYNYHAVHYFNKIKDMIARLDENMTSKQIIERLIKFEEHRHQNNECECREHHDLLGSEQLNELFVQLLEYYYSVPKPYSEFNNMYMRNAYKYLN